jgi:hypothetical protein
MAQFAYYQGWHLMCRCANVHIRAPVGAWEQFADTLGLDSNCAPPLAVDIWTSLMNCLELRPKAQENVLQITTKKYMYFVLDYGGFQAWLSRL